MEKGPLTIEDVVYEGDIPEPEDTIRGRVRVVQTPATFSIELAFSKPDLNEFNVTRYYTPSESRELANQLRSGEAENLISKLGEFQSEQIADELELAGQIAGSKAIGEVVGDDVIKAYKEDKITEEEFVHEFGHEVDKSLEERE